MSDLHDTRRLDADLDRIETEPYYEPVGAEVALFEAAWASLVPVLLKGPDGLRQDSLRRVHGLAPGPEQGATRGRPLVTVSCHEDLTARTCRALPDRGGETVWIDGPPRGREDGRHLLPGRDRRGAQGHHRRHPSAHRLPPHAAHRQARRAAQGAPAASCW